MPRLHYDALPNTAVNTNSELESATTGVPANPVNTNNDQVMEKMIKLIPSEIVAAYLALIGFANSFTWEYMIYVFFGLCLIMTPLYLYRLSEAGRPKRNHIIVSTVAFVVWAIATSGNLLFEQFVDYQQAYGSSLLVIFSLVSGLVPLNK